MAAVFIGGGSQRPSYYKNVSQIDTLRMREPLSWKLNVIKLDRSWAYSEWLIENIFHDKVYSNPRAMEYNDYKFLLNLLILSKLAYIYVGRYIYMLLYFNQSLNSSGVKNIFFTQGLKLVQCRSSTAKIREYLELPEILIFV